VTAGPATQAARPRDYRILVPAGWFLVGLTSDRLERSVRALVNRQFRGVDHQPALRRDLIETLLREAEQARRAGGIELYVATDAVGPLPLAASLVVTLLPDIPTPFGALSPPDWCEYLLSQGEDASLVELPAGTAVRSRRRGEPRPDDQLRNTLPTTSLDVRVPVPNSSHYLLLSFSTPVEPLADAFVELFDAIATSLRWVAGA
jgi:hypothetical protein